MQKVVGAMFVGAIVGTHFDKDTGDVFGHYLCRRTENVASTGAMIRYLDRADIRDEGFCNGQSVCGCYDSGKEEFIPAVFRAVRHPRGGCFEERRSNGLYVGIADEDP